MRTTDTVERVKDEVERLRTRAGQAVEDGMDAAERSLRKTREGLKDTRDEAVYRVKRQPLMAVAVAFGAGALFGIVLGLLRRDRSA